MAAAVDRSSIVPGNLGEGSELKARQIRETTSARHSDRDDGHDVPSSKSKVFRKDKIELNRGEILTCQRSGNFGNGVNLTLCSPCS
jgi:hypothetical protein